MKKLALNQIWKSETPKEQIPRIGHKSSGIFRLQLTPDNRFAVTLNYQYRELIIWDFSSGEKLFNMHVGDGYDKVYDLYLSPDGHYCVVTGETFRVVPISSDYQKPSHPFPLIIM